MRLELMALSTKSRTDSFAVASLQRDEAVQAKRLVEEAEPDVLPAI